MRSTRGAIESTTGVARGRARAGRNVNSPVGNQRRALRSAAVLTGSRTPAMQRADRNYDRRVSMGGKGG